MMSAAAQDEGGRRVAVAARAQRDVRQVYAPFGRPGRLGGAPTSEAREASLEQRKKGMEMTP